MAQIAYRATSLGSLRTALNTIVSANPNILSFNAGNDEFFAFYFANEPTTCFELQLKLNANIQATENNMSFILAKMYEKESGSSIITERLPYTIDYKCIAEQGYASRTYIGNTSGTFDVFNILSVEDIYNYYIFFDDDYLAIVAYENGRIASYIVCSCRSEKDGNGGYILSSDSVLLRRSDSHVFRRFLSGGLLNYYNRFGVYKPGYPIDSVDSTYCSVSYSSLTGYSERVPLGGDRYATVRYEFTKNWYGNCTCSLLFDSNFTNKLPNYNNLVKYLDDFGSPSMSNTLNGISLLLPNYFFIDVAPLSTHEYKYVFDTPEMCYCSMYNMLGGNIVQQSYPTKGNKFMCFSLTTSNEKSRKSGYYNGFAFELPLRIDDIIDDYGIATTIER